MLTIAVALATLNGESYLRAQLESLANQTSKPSELVVVDDGSTDGTLKIVNEFSSQASFPVRLLRNDRQVGYRASFVKAAELCDADVVVFCDQDDLWSPQKIEILQRVFAADNDALLVYHNSLLVDATGTSLRKTIFPPQIRTHSVGPLQFCPFMIVPGHVQAIRRSLIKFNALHSASVDPYVGGELMPHDMWYLFWASVLGKIIYLPDVLVHYRLHAGNTTGWYRNWFSFALDHIRNARLYTNGNVTAAENRLSLLKQASNLVDPDQRPSIISAVGFYQSLVAECEQRAAIYNSPNLLSRSRAFIKFLQDRNYKAGSKYSGFDALLLDLVFGVLFNTK